MKNIDEATWILENTWNGRSPRRAVAKTLIGEDLSFFGFFTVNESCKERKSLPASCDSEELSRALGAQRCLQVSCEGPGLESAQVWWKSAPFRYQPRESRYASRAHALASLPSVTYETEPLARFTYDVSRPGEILIRWMATDTAQLTLAPLDAPMISLDASSQLSGSALIRDSGPEWAEFVLTYSQISLTRQISSIEVRIDSKSQLQGRITVGGQPVAGIEGLAHHPAVRWLAACQ